MVLGLAAIPLALAARSISVLLPLCAIRPGHRYGLVAPVTLIWGGLRGGISIALALGLPDGPARPVILAATYLVVLFSVIGQGGTIKGVLERLTASAVRSYSSLPLKVRSWVGDHICSTPARPETVSARPTPG